MKRLIYIIPIALIAFSSFSSGQNVTSKYDDDIYFDPNDELKKEDTSINSNAVINKTNTEVFDSLKNGQISDDEYYSDVEGDDEFYYDEFEYDDYYDYSYASRIKRFHRPYSDYYYDAYYTNSYWYNYNPDYWGVSIYLGYPWWHSHSYWYPSYYNSWYYRPYYYDSYGYNPYYSSYWNGYNRGYWNGYYDGYYGGHYYANDSYYYNSYDQTNYNYGHRSSVATDGVTNTGIRPGTRESFVSKYESEVATAHVRTSRSKNPIVF